MANGKKDGDDAVGGGVQATKPKDRKDDAKLKKQEKEAAKLAMEVAEEGLANLQREAEDELLALLEESLVSAVTSSQDTLDLFAALFPDQTEANIINACGTSADETAARFLVRVKQAL